MWFGLIVYTKRGQKQHVFVALFCPQPKPGLLNTEKYIFPKLSLILVS